MSEGLEHARSLAAAAARSYATLKRSAEAEVVRWEWATSAARSYEPAYFELAKVKPGRVLAAEPPRSKGVW